MPSQISITKKCQLLEQQKETLRRAVLEELSRHKELLLRHNLLSAWCECLSLIQMNKMSQHIDGCWSANGRDQEQEFERLLEKEMLLLRQLPATQADTLSKSSSGLAMSISPTPEDAASVLGVGVDTIAPPGEPMAYFKHLINQPPLENAASISLQAMGELMREASLQLSVHLHILENSVAEQHASAERQLKQALDRVVHAALSLVMVGREDVVEHANIVNLHTLAPDIEGATRQAAQTASLIDKLALTPQQLQVVATGSTMYMQMLEAVVQERQGLQSQFAEGAAPTSSASASSSGSGSSGEVAPGDQQQPRLEGVLGARQRALEAQQKQAARLQLLIRKEMMLRMAGMAWFLGCLSVHQVAKACVLCWPYTLRPSLLAQLIQKRVEAQQAGGAGSPGGGAAQAWSSGPPNANG